MYRNKVIILALLASICSVGPVFSEDDRPNIVFILADDLGYGDLACYGREDIKTPNLDQLARDGVRFTSHYANGAECTPTRTAFLTGRYQQRVGGLECAIGTGNVGRYDDAVRLRATHDLGLPAEEQTIARLLCDAGYSTAITGKWHLGYEPKFAPHLHGFDHAFYCIGGGMDYFHYLDTVAGYNLFQNGNPIRREGHFTDLATDEAIEFLKRQTKDKPFFLYLPYTCPHSPFQGPDDKRADPLPLDSPLWSQGNAPPDVYVAMIEHMDRRIGDVLESLDRRGFSNDTIVIFASDKNNVELDANGGLRGNKGSVYEGGIRVPLVMRWPAKITADSALKAGTTTDRVVDITDLLPTFCELAGAPTPVGIDGVSIAPTLLSTGHQRNREFIIHEAGGSSSIIRGRHKLIRSVPKRSKKVTWELYDLDDDHAEQNNIAGKHPEIAGALKGQLLGERVTEPKGFANTYHSWTGKDGDTASDANNWSDYTYANAGRTFITETGWPESSWTAHMNNSGNASVIARADSDLQFLGLQIAGNSKTKARQTLALNPGVDLVGVNEIRLAPQSTLTIDGGTVSSRRWLDISPEASLRGNGTIAGMIYNSGSLILAGKKQPVMKIYGKYHQTAKGTLDLRFSGTTSSTLVVNGNVSLAGKLAVTTTGGFTRPKNVPLTVLTSTGITGKFDNPNNTVIASDGTRFKIRYSGGSVKLSIN